MAAPTTPIAELEVVRLQVAHPEARLLAGAIGAVVLMHEQGEAYEVEFVRPDRETQAVLTLSAAEVVAVEATWRSAA